MPSSWYEDEDTEVIYENTDNLFDRTAVVEEDEDGKSSRKVWFGS